jgi:hypothetical protein
MKKALFALTVLVYAMQSVGARLRTEEIDFVSHGATLYGSIVLPAGGEIHAAVVFVHDRSIPVDLSVERLQALRRSGRQYDYVLFSGLGHNNMDRTFFVATEWIRRSGSHAQALGR